MKKLLLQSFLLAALIGLLTWGCAPLAQASTSPLTPGKCNKAVLGLQWMLQGHKPSAYYQTVHPFHRKLNGCYGAYTKSSVKAAKWRMGWPLNAVASSQGPIAGPWFIKVLKGQLKRPLSYVEAAVKRLRPTPQPIPWQSKLVSAARNQLGTHEEPWGSNWGYWVRQYLAAAGVYYPAPWCAAFQQWVRAHIGWHRIAYGSASVYYIIDWSKQHTLVRAVAKPGMYAAFLDHGGHLGLISEVGRYGFWTIDGNYSDRVIAVYRHWGERAVVFIEASPVN